jgi:hypothetical protein
MFDNIQVCVVPDRKIFGTSSIADFLVNPGKMLSNLAVRYEVIGGNHRMAATKQCFKEHADRTEAEAMFGKMDSSIYVGLTDLEAIAVSHF